MSHISHFRTDRQADPKLAWALEHRELFPVDVNRAPRELLLRIPGMGPRTVEKILQTRDRRDVGVADLRGLRLPWPQLRYFVAAADHRPRPAAPTPPTPRGSAAPRQRQLFESPDLPSPVPA